MFAAVCAQAAQEQARQVKQDSQQRYSVQENHGHRERNRDGFGRLSKVQQKLLGL